MKKLLLFLIIGCASLSANAQLKKLVNARTISAATKTVDALTLTDEQMANYCKEFIEWSDENNKICDDSAPELKVYADRLASILGNCDAQVKSNYDIKVYYVIDQNAFACPNGSIRVFAGLMDIMTDDQILAIIGHEIGHIVNKDSKDAFKNALLTSALKDAVGSINSNAAALTDSQLGDLGMALSQAQFSQKQEYAADDYGYHFIAACGRDGKAMASALRVIENLQAGGDNSKINQLFSSHPESGKRAERLEKL